MYINDINIKNCTLNTLGKRKWFRYLLDKYSTVVELFVVQNWKLTKISYAHLHYICSKDYLTLH